MCLWNEEQEREREREREREGGRGERGEIGETMTLKRDEGADEKGK